jgi:hypothetical protein
VLSGEDRVDPPPALTYRRTKSIWILPFRCDSRFRSFGNYPRQISLDADKRSGTRNAEGRGNFDLQYIATFIFDMSGRR